MASLVAQSEKSAYKAGDLGLSPRLGRYNPLQYSCLGNPMDRGAWWATVHGGHKRIEHDLVTEQYFVPSN